MPQNVVPGQQENILTERGLPSLFVDGLFQFFTALLLFIALLYRQTGLIALALLILLMVNGAKLWCRLSLAGLRCRYSVDKEKVFPGEQVVFKAEVENHSFFPVWMKIKIPLVKTLSAAFTGSNELSGENTLLWRQKIELQWGLTALRRGYFPVEWAELAAGDLLGFFQRKKVIPHSGQIIVFPRLVPLKPYSFLQEDFFGTQATKSPVQDPVYPIATRDYQHGRPARHIHWKASARHNRLQEKIFEPTAQGKNLLLVDVKQFAEKKAGDLFESTLEVVGSLAVEVEKHGDSVGFASNGILAEGGRAVLPAVRGRPGHLSALLALLGRLQMEYLGTVEDVLKTGKLLSRGSRCICFFLQVDEALFFTQKIFDQYKIPAVFITGQAGSNLQKTGSSEIYSLHELCCEEGAAGTTKKGRHGGLSRG